MCTCFFFVIVYDLFFNPATNSGYLVAKLKNFNSKRRKLTPSQEKNLESDTGSDNESIAISQEDLSFFKNCLVEDERTIKEKLQQTLKARVRYCTADINILEAFPIFLYDSSLVIKILKCSKTYCLIHYLYPYRFYSILSSVTAQIQTSS